MFHLCWILRTPARPTKQPPRTQGQTGESKFTSSSTVTSLLLLPSVLAEHEASPHLWLGSTSRAPYKSFSALFQRTRKRGTCLVFQASKCRSGKKFPSKSTLKATKVSFRPHGFQNSRLQYTWMIKSKNDYSVEKLSAWEGDVVPLRKDEGVGCTSFKMGAYSLKVWKPG